MLCPSKEQYLLTHPLGGCYTSPPFNQGLIMVQEKTSFCLFYLRCFLLQFDSQSPFPLERAVPLSLHLLVERVLYVSSADTVVYGSACPIGGCCISTHSVSFSAGAWVKPQQSSLPLPAWGVRDSKLFPALAPSL